MQTVLTGFVLWCSLISSVSLRADDSSPQPILREPATRQAWEWTLQERLDARFDPVKIGERETAYLIDNPQAQSHLYASEAKMEHPDPHMVSYRIDGRRNPELFLPHELFDTLVSGFAPDADLRERQRAYYRPAIRAFGFDDEQFWARLESVIHPYIALSHSYVVFGHAGQSSTKRPTADEICRARFDALQAARGFFGRETFDRFLYVVIAPSAWAADMTTFRDPIAMLRRAEEGCQR
jgi:hypothetical protein